jgi:hypothetical protein
VNQIFLLEEGVALAFDSMVIHDTVRVDFEFDMI